MFRFDVDAEHCWLIKTFHGAMPWEDAPISENEIEDEIVLYVMVGKTPTGGEIRGGDTPGHNLYNSRMHQVGGAFVEVSPNTKTLTLTGESERFGSITPEGKEIALRLLEKLRSEKFPSYHLVDATRT